MCRLRLVNRSSIGGGGCCDAVALPFTLGAMTEFVSAMDGMCDGASTKLELGPIVIRPTRPETR